MNKGIVSDISCDVCRDLIPLVADGVASEDSEALVHSHVAHCPACQAYLDSGGIQLPPPEPNAARVLGRIQRKLLAQSALMAVAGFVVCLALANGPFLAWGLPALGAAGYVFLRRSVWFAAVISAIPMALVLLVSTPNRTSLMQAGLYLAALLVGALIAKLLHFAFGGLRRGKSDPKEESLDE